MTSAKISFRQMSQDELALIASYGACRAYPKNAILVTEGDPSEMFYLIQNGQAKVYVSDENGKEVFLNLLGAGDYFGEIAIIDQAPRSASVITAEACQIVVVSKREFERCLAEHPALALRLIHNLVKSVRSLTEQVKRLALLDVYGRISNTLSGLAKEKNGERMIEQRLTHQDIANMVGSSREMVSRIMKDLSAGGYIRIDRRRIIIEKQLPAKW